MEFPIGKKLFHLVVNPGMWPGARSWTWNWYKLQETSMEHDIPFGNSNRENGTTFLDFPLFLGIFQWDEPTKGVPFTAEPEIPEILTKWKAPVISYNLRIIQDYFQPKIGRKIRIFSLGRKNNILIKKKECIRFCCLIPISI